MAQSASRVGLIGRPASDGWSTGLAYPRLEAGCHYISTMVRHTYYSDRLALEGPDWRGLRLPGSVRHRAEVVEYKGRPGTTADTAASSVT